MNEKNVGRVIHQPSCNRVIKNPWLRKMSMQDRSKGMPKGFGVRAIFTMVTVIIISLSSMASLAESVDLTAMSLEELMEIEITSVARKPQKLLETAAAAFIITQEDIRRSGVTNIMDALRMAPGIQVAQIDGNKWAVTSRGFNDRFANKLLVLMDGRAIYSPFFSGVLWEEQDVMLEDIERIEVIRGPGASVWGANAVNGIINIISKNAADSQGSVVIAGGGTHERVFGAVRHGGKLGGNAHYRLFAKAADRKGFDETSGQAGNNDWTTSMAGFRADGEFSVDDRWSLHGNIRAEAMEQSYKTPILVDPYQLDVQSETDTNGGYLLGRWDHGVSTTSETTLQVYYAHDVYDDVNARVMDDTVDLDFQHTFLLGNRQEITWGAGYRFIRTDTEPGMRVYFDPKEKHDQLFSTFVQDEIEIIQETVWLTVGSKFEHNDYTGFEVQPSARFRWQVDETNTLWAAVSRAVRTPSRSETTTRYRAEVLPPAEPDSSDPTAVTIFGNENLNSEIVWAYEAGYRLIPNSWMSLDVAVFYNQYDDETSMELEDINFSTDPVSHNVVLLGLNNAMDGYSYGFEAAADFIPQAWWKLRLAYTWLEVSLDAKNDVISSSMEEAEGYSPKHQVSLFSTMDFPHDVQLDTWFRYVDKLEKKDVPSYFTLDARIAWKPIENIEFSIVGRNLLEDDHREYYEDYLNTAATSVERSVYGKLTWSF